MDREKTILIQIYLCILISELAVLFCLHFEMYLVQEDAAKMSYINLSFWGEVSLTEPVHICLDRAFTSFPSRASSTWLAKRKVRNWLSRCWEQRICLNYIIDPSSQGVSADDWESRAWAQSPSRGGFHPASPSYSSRFHESEFAEPSCSICPLSDWSFSWPNINKQIHK